MNEMALIEICIAWRAEVKMNGNIGI